MFDKSRAQLEQVQARFAKFEEDHEAMRKVHQHFVKHQTVYACGATAVVSVVSTRMFGRPTVIVQNVMDKTSDAAAQIPQIINTPVFNNMPVIDITNTINNAGHLHKIVQRLADGEIFEKAGDAAMDIAERHDITYGTARWMLSKHLNGSKDDVYGEVYKIIGVGTTG
jgi:hypothetical protein